jgi:hypothetical protein
MSNTARHNHRSFTTLINSSWQRGHSKLRRSSRGSSGSMHTSHICVPHRGQSGYPTIERGDDGAYRDGRTRRTPYRADGSAPDARRPANPALFDIRMLGSTSRRKIGELIANTHTDVNHLALSDICVHNARRKSRASLQS